MRKVLLLAALCMALAFVLSAPAMAQSASASPPAGEGNPCFGLEGAEAEECYAEFGIGPPASAPPVALCTDPDFPRETPDGCQASDLPDVEFGPDATASPSSTASPSAGREGDPCGSFVIGTPEADECYRGFGLDPLEPGDASATASPTASASASASASATASASALPETGGPATAALALVPLALFVGTGLLAFRIVRRS